jgi:hypothetical protein
VRDSGLWIGKKAAKDIRAAGLSPQDFLQPLENLKAKFYDSRGEGHPAEKQVDELLKKYEDLREAMQGLPGDLVATVVKEMNAHVGAVKKWRSGIHKKLEEGEEVTVRGIEKLYALVYPDNTFQERHDNLIALHMQLGAGWMKSLFENFSPEAPALHIFSGE